MSLKHRNECLTAKVFGNLKCYCLFELCINVAMPQEFLCLILLCFVTFFNQITTNSEMNDFFLSLSACSCIYIVSQYIAQINTTRHLCKQHLRTRERPFIQFDDKFVAPEIPGTMKIAELLWPFQSQDMGLVHRKIINSLSFYQCVRMLTSRTSRYIG